MSKGRERRVSQAEIISLEKVQETWPARGAGKVRLRTFSVD